MKRPQDSATKTGPKLVAALDTKDARRAERLAEGMVSAGVDVLEIGTPLLKAAGSSAIRRIRELFPQQALYADLKAMDFAEEEIPPALEAGANFVSLHALADSQTLATAQSLCAKQGARLFISTLGLPSRWAVSKLRAMDYRGVEGIVAHGNGPPASAFQQMMKAGRALRRLPGIGLCVGGGVNATNAARLAPLAPRYVFVGRAIAHSKNPAKEIEKIRRNITWQT